MNEAPAVDGFRSPFQVFALTGGVMEGIRHTGTHGRLEEGDRDHRVLSHSQILAVFPVGR